MKVTKKSLLAIGITLFLLLLAQPAWAVSAQSERKVLTLELLQERLRSPINREGVPTLDLRQLVIDLRPENASFRDSFYQLLRTQLQRAGSNPLGLDLSHSLIQGDLNGSDLGLRTPYGQALAPIFTPTELEQLERDRQRLAQLKGISRSFLGSSLVAPLQITVFRGPLKLVQTRFTGSVNTNTFFLQPVEAPGAIFIQEANWTETRFSRDVSFAGATFRQAASFRGSIFLVNAEFNQAQFQESAIFTGSTFKNTANFNQASFKQMANFSRVQWLGNADFFQARYSGQALFTKDQFNQSFFLTYDDPGVCKPPRFIRW